MDLVLGQKYQLTFPDARSTDTGVYRYVHRGQNFIFATDDRLGAMIVVSPAELPTVQITAWTPKDTPRTARRPGRIVTGGRKRRRGGDNHFHFDPGVDGDEYSVDAENNERIKKRARQRRSRHRTGKKPRVKMDATKRFRASSML